MEKSSFFNSVNGDRKYKAEEIASYFASFIGNGVFPNPSTSLQVASNNNMTVTLKPGKAWINGYFYSNTDDLILNINASDGTLDRIDRVVLRLDFVNREIKAYIKKGMFASNPIATTLQRDMDRYEIGIADIYVGKGTASISQANITDLRQDNNFCGIVHGVVDQVDVTTLFNQYDAALSQKEASFEDEFQTWFNSIKGQLSGDVAANLTNQLAVLQSDFNAHKTESTQQIGNINDDTLPVELKGKSLTEMAKVNFQSGINAKQKVVTALNAEGASVTTNNTWNEISNAIPTIAGSKLTLLAAGQNKILSSIDSDSNLYYFRINTSAPTAYKYDKKGTLIKSFDPPLYYCYIKAVTKDGCFVTNNASDKLYHYDWNGTLIKQYPSSASSFIKLKDKYLIGSNVYDINMTYIGQIAGTVPLGRWQTTGDDDNIYTSSDLTNIEGSLYRINLTAMQSYACDYPRGLMLIGLAQDFK